MSNPNREVFKYVGQCTAKHYNQFFNPNICHVCKSVDKGNLILCDGCYLISYCSEIHKTVHREEHAKICIIIAEVLKAKSQGETCRYSDWQQWIQSRKEFMESIQQKFDRPMEPYIQQMILWAKSCVVCHQQDKLRVCERCFSANYCDEHAEVFHKSHEGDKCDRLLRLLNIDIETISGNTTNISYELLALINANSRFEEMLEFCMEYMLLQREHLDWLAKDYVQSDYLSGPLTVYSGLKRIDSLNLLRETSVIVHIITSNTVERNDVPAWEIWLHLIPNIQDLIIVMIGSKLEYKCDTLKICSSCVCRKKKLLLLSFPMSYHDYIKSNASYKRATIIVGFQVEFDKEETWLECIKAYQSTCGPLFLSYSSEKKARDNIIKIQKILCKNVEPIFNKKNHFSGLAPHRNLETGDTYFHNEHLIIYDLVDLYFDESNASSNE